MPLKFQTHSGQSVEVSPSRVVIAGFTGSNRETVERHIAELSHAGVPAPSSIPSFYVVEPATVVLGGPIAVSSRESSGEVEPVLIATNGRWYMGLGSDHTDRELEKTDIGLSKAVCPKVISQEVVPYSEIVETRAAIRLRSWVDAGHGWELYQDGFLTDLLPAEEIVEEMQRAVGRCGEEFVLFLGTVPLETSTFVYGKRYRMQLEMPNGGQSIELTYETLLEEDE